MSRRNVKVGEKFPEEETPQSTHSPGIVRDEEFLERELRHKNEVYRGIEPTEAAFPRKQLLGRNGSGLSVTRRDTPSPQSGAGVLNFRKVLQRAYARVGELREICDEGENRMVSIVDAGTKENPSHAEIFLKSEGARRPMEGRLRILRAFGGRAKRERNERNDRTSTGEI